MPKPTVDADTILKRATPLTGQHAHEVQPFSHLVRMPIALSEHACKESVENLNQLLADTMTLRDLYKKHHWQVAGPTFYQLHLLFDKHYDEQNEMVDAIAERIQLLGGVSVAMAHDVAETTLFPRAPKGREKCRSEFRPCYTHTRSCSMRRVPWRGTRPRLETTARTIYS
jgi:starvation-inducible DNA-binding protein